MLHIMYYTYLCIYYTYCMHMHIQVVGDPQLSFTPNRFDCLQKSSITACREYRQYIPSYIAYIAVIAVI